MVAGSATSSSKAPRQSLAGAFALVLCVVADVRPTAVHMPGPKIEDRSFLPCGMGPALPVRPCTVSRDRAALSGAISRPYQPEPSTRGMLVGFGWSLGSALSGKDGTAGAPEEKRASPVERLDGQSSCIFYTIV